MRLNRISLNTISLNRIGLNRIGFPSRGSSSSSERPYIDPEVLASLKAVCICYGKSNDDEDRAIIKNLVDPDNPFICSNFAWKLNSGYGKYETDFSDADLWVSRAHNRVTYNKIVVTESLVNSWVLFTSKKKGIIPSYSVRITGLNPKLRLAYYYSSTGDDVKIYDIPSDGIYTVPESIMNGNVNDYTGFQFIDISNKSDAIGLTIEQIPSYQGALVTDGQDDIIRSTKTVEEMLEGSTECTVVSMVVNLDSRLSTSSNVLGSRYLRNQISANKEDKYGIFGYTSSDINSVGNISLINNILGDKKDYIASYSNAGGVQDYFFIDGYLTTDGSPSDCRMKAIFGTFISNKVLTSDQINQVIAYFNLDRCVGPLMYLNTIKQGITNENHASFNDELTDFSGNGHNVQLYNIGWKGNSGIGKYEVDFTEWSKSGKVTFTDYKSVTWSSESSYHIIYFGTDIGYDIPSFKAHIETSGIIYYTYIDSSGTKKAITISVSGDYEFPMSYNTLWTGEFDNIGFTTSGGKGTIVQIPSHQSALVTDGINDFGMVEELPVLKDYTVVADREVIDGLVENIDGGVALKGNKYLEGAFTFDYKDGVYSFGTYERIAPNTERFISYQSKYMSNGIDIKAGTAVDNDNLWLAKLGVDERYSKIALRSFLLFPYSLSEFLLERQLKRYKIGTLYPGMVELRPIITSNSVIKSIRYFTSLGTELYVGGYIPVGNSVYMKIEVDEMDEISLVKVNGKEAEKTENMGEYYYVFEASKSPQRISVIVDLYTVQDLLDKDYAIIETRNSRNILRIKQAREDKTLPRISDWDTWIIDKGYVPSFEGLDATSDTWSYLLSLIKDYTYIGSSVWYGGEGPHGAFRQAVGLNGLNVEINIDLHDERYLNFEGAFYQCTASYVTLNLKGEGNISVMQSCFAGTPNLSKVVLNPIDNPDLVIYPHNNSAILDWCNCVDGDPLPITGFQLTRNCGYCYQNTPVETINVVWDDVNILLFAFKNCSNLVNVTNEIPISSDATEVPVIDAFTNCPNLTNIRLKGIVRGDEEADYTWDFSGCSKLSKESIQYMLENARSNADITGIINYNGACKSYFENGDISEDVVQTFIGKNWKIQIDGVDYLPSYLTSLSNTTLISNETLIKNE